MSLDIYGFQLGNMSLMELQNFSRNLRSVMSSKHNELLLKLCARKIEEMVDSFILYDFETVSREFTEEFGRNFSPTRRIGSSLYWGIHEKIESVRRSRTREDVDYDLNASVVFIPTPTKVLATFHAEQSEYRELWKTIPRVNEYQYWNHSEKPKKLSLREWKRRENDWRTALRGFRSPAENGLEINLTVHSYVRNFDLALPLISSFEDRVRAHARKTVINNKFHELMAEQSDKKYEVRNYRKAAKWVLTPEAEVQVELASIEIEKLLPVEITDNNLRMTPMELKEKYAK